MKKFLTVWLLNLIGLWVIDQLMKSVYIADFQSLLFTSLILALLNHTLKPFLKLISLPITVVTLGLFSLIINALVLELAFALSSGSYINSFGSAFLAAILLSIVNACMESLVKEG